MNGKDNSFKKMASRVCPKKVIEEEFVDHLLTYSQKKLLDENDIKKIFDYYQYGEEIFKNKKYGEKLKGFFNKKDNLFFRTWMRICRLILFCYK